MNEQCSGEGKAKRLSTFHLSWKCSTVLRASSDPEKKDGRVGDQRRGCWGSVNSSVSRGEKLTGRAAGKVEGEWTCHSPCRSLTFITHRCGRVCFEVASVSFQVSPFLPGNSVRCVRRLSGLVGGGVA